MRSTAWAIAFTLVVVDALSARTWLSRGRPTSQFIVGASPTTRDLPLVLGMLPVPLADALLPGETRTMCVDDELQRTMLRDAIDGQDSCFGQLLMRTAEGEVTGVAPLLEVSGSEEMGNGLEVRVRCVGRVRLTEVHQANAGYIMAKVEPYADDEEDITTEQEEMASALTSAILDDPEASEAARARTDAQKSAEEAAAEAIAASAQAAGVSQAAVVEAAMELLNNLGGEVRRSHASVVGMRARLRDCASAGLPADVADEMEAHGEEWLTSLDDLLATRREQLFLAAGDDPRGLAGEGADGEAARTGGTAGGKAGAGGASVYPAMSGEMSELWGVRDEEEAARQLLSFAAAATAGNEIRTHALLTQSSSERLSAVLCALRESERRLAAVLALEQLSGGGEEGAGGGSGRGQPRSGPPHMLAAGDDEASGREASHRDTSGRRTGRRVGGGVAPPKQADARDGPPVGLLRTGVGLGLFLVLLRGLVGTAEISPEIGYYSYSVSSFSETVVRIDDGSGEPKYETRRESSFKTNVPGLAERLAEQGVAPEDAMPALPPPLPFPF